MERAIPRGVAKIAFGTGLKNAFTHEGNQSMAAGDVLKNPAQSSLRDWRIKTSQYPALKTPG